MDVRVIESMYVVGMNNKKRLDDVGAPKYRFESKGETGLITARHLPARYTTINQNSCFVPIGQVILAVPT